MIFIFSLISTVLLSSLLVEINSTNLCPLRTYQPDVNTISFKTCIKCPFGTYQQFNGYSCFDPAKAPIPLSNMSK